MVDFDVALGHMHQNRRYADIMLTDKMATDKMSKDKMLNKQNVDRQNAYDPIFANLIQTLTSSDYGP